MGILNRLFGKKTSIQDSNNILSTEQIEKVLLELKSNDLKDRMMAMGKAARLLGQNEPGALKPYLVALSDKDAMLRGAAVIQLAESAIDEITKNTLRNIMSDSEEGHKLIDLLKDMSEKDPESFIQEGSQRALHNILLILKQHSELPQKKVIPIEDKPNTNTQTPQLETQKPINENSRAKIRKTTLYAYLVETQSTGLPGFRQTVVVPASEEELKEKIRTNARCKDAEVMIVPPKEWSPPQFSSVSQQELTTKFPLVMVRVQDHMARSGLPRVSQDELVRNGSIIPNPVSGKVFFVYKITL